MRKTFGGLIVFAMAVLLAGAVHAGEPSKDNGPLAMGGKHANPCAMKNPCAGNPCNPCATKNPCNPCSANPCNPCSMKNPCNPCSMRAPSQSPPLRKEGFKDKAAAAAYGEKLWKSTELGTTGLACNSCHEDGKLLKRGVESYFPRYVKMPNDVVTLDQMINYCVVNPLGGKPLGWDSREMTGLAVYYKTLVHERMGDDRGGKNPCMMKNPCSGK